MLSSRNRFHGHGSLRFVYANGKIVRSRFFVCKYSVNPRRTTPRVAVVVSKKIIKSAVKRNRIRRRLYEAIRTELPNVSPKSDIVFIVVSVEVLTAPSTELVSAVQQAFHQAGLYNTAS